MKLSLFLTLAFISNFLLSQEKLLDVLPVQGGKVTYIEVIQVDSVTKDQLFERAKRWFVDTYKSSQDVIQLEDKENGEIIGKGVLSSSWQSTAISLQPVDIWHTVTIQAKDNRYRYIITDLQISYTVDATQYTQRTEVDLPFEEWNVRRKANAKKYYLVLDEQMQSIIKSINEAMTKDVVSDDW